MTFVPLAGTYGIATGVTVLGPRPRARGGSPPWSVRGDRPHLPVARSARGRDAIAMDGPIREHYLLAPWGTPDEGKYRTEVC